MAAANPSSSSHLSGELSCEMRLCLVTVRARRSWTKEVEGIASPGTSRVGQIKGRGGGDVMGVEEGGREEGGVVGSEEGGVGG